MELFIKREVSMSSVYILDTGHDLSLSFVCLFVTNYYIIVLIVIVH